MKLRFVKVDSEEIAGQDGHGKNAVDGDPGTFWHTQWQGSSPGLPHEIVIELLPPCVIQGFTCLPRQDESDHGTIKDFEFYVSDDGKHFGRPVKKGTFEAGKERKIETFAPIQCRFIKLRALSEINGLPWTSAAEIGVLQCGATADFEEAEAGGSPIAVSLAIPSHNGGPSVEYHDRNSVFHVIVSNTSDTPRRVWRDSCSWGGSGLAFEMKDESGEEWVATRKAPAWTRNVPDWWTLKPHESLVMEVCFADSEIWQGFPLPETGSRTVTMRALLEFKPDDESRQHDVWTGRVASKAEQVTFYHWKPSDFPP